MKVNFTFFSSCAVVTSDQTKWRNRILSGIWSGSCQLVPFRLLNTPNYIIIFLILETINQKHLSLIRAFRCFASNHLTSLFELGFIASLEDLSSLKLFFLSNLINFCQYWGSSNPTSSNFFSVAAFFIKVTWRIYKTLPNISKRNLHRCQDDLSIALFWLIMAVSSCIYD
jgi:hypothetical protein